MLPAASAQRRPTRDLDVHAQQRAGDVDTVRDLIANIAVIGLGDGLDFGTSDDASESITAGRAVPEPYGIVAAHRAGATGARWRSHRPMGLSRHHAVDLTRRQRSGSPTHDEPAGQSSLARSVSTHVGDRAPRQGVAWRGGGMPETRGHRCPTRVARPALPDTPR